MRDCKPELRRLVRRLRNAEPGLDRESIWHEIGDIGRGDEVRHLSYLLNTPGWGVRPEDRRALLEPSDKPLRRLPPSQIEKIKRDIEEMGSADNDRAWRAISRLGRRRGQVVELLAEATASPNTVIRHNALHALEAIGDPRAFPVVLAMKDDPVDDLRWCALRTAGALGKERAIPVLVQKLRNHSAYAELAGACDGLVAVGTPAIPVLTELLDDGNPDVRGVAAHALRDIGDKTAIPHMARLLAHTDPETRTAGVEQLAMMAEDRPTELGQQVLRLIEPLTDDPVQEVRENAQYWCSEIERALKDQGV